MELSSVIEQSLLEHSVTSSHFGNSLWLTKFLRRIAQCSIQFRWMLGYIDCLRGLAR